MQVFSLFYKDNVIICNLFVKLFIWRKYSNGLVIFKIFVHCYEHTNILKRLREIIIIKQIFKSQKRVFLRTLTEVQSLIPINVKVNQEKDIWY